MPRRRSVIPVYGSKDTTTVAPSRPYQWRRDGRTRDAAIKAAGLGTARPSTPEPAAARTRMTRDEILAAIDALRDRLEDTP